MADAVWFPKPCRGFVFEIKDVFGIKNVGTVLTGYVATGSAGAGDPVSCGPVPGHVDFMCSIQKIDLGVKTGGERRRLQPVDRAVCGEPSAGSYFIYMGDTDPRKFHIGDYLFIE